MGLWMSTNHMGLFMNVNQSHGIMDSKSKFNEPDEKSYPEDSRSL